MLNALTFVPVEEINKLQMLKVLINEAKKRLAFEITKLVHGEEEALKAKSAAEALFSGGVDMSNVPTVTISKEKLGSTLLDIIAETK